MKTVSTILAALLLTAATSFGDFIPVNGTFNGLFFEPDGYWDQSSGIISLKTTSKARFSGRVQVGPSRYSISGYFDEDGKATTAILRRYQNPLTVRLQVDPEDPDLIFGTIDDGVWVADLIADRAVFNGKTSVSPDFGQYTMIIPGDFTSSSQPGGDGFGTITIDRAGRIKFAGSLADGTKVSQSSTISKGGQWPLFASLYRGGGALWGWMLFNKSAEDPAVLGDVTWIASPAPRARYYPNGFAITIGAWGSYYVRPLSNQKILNVSDASVEFNGGNIYSGTTNVIVLEQRNRVSNLSPNGLKLSFSTSKGTFTGRVMHPVTWEWIKFQGVVLQDYGVAAGYFLGWSRSGEVWLEGF